MLQQELRNTAADLQVMRPMAGVGSLNYAGSGSRKPAVVKNGMNQEKWFQQVHYLKVGKCIHFKFLFLKPLVFF